MSLTATPPLEDLFGKTVNDIQQPITIDGNNVAVTPIEVLVPWTGFSSVASEQTGYYMSFVAEVEDADHVDVIMQRGSADMTAKKARIPGSKDSVVMFLGDTEALAEGVTGIKIIGYDSSDKKIGQKVYNLVVTVE